MKSNREQLISRGYLDEGAESGFGDMPYNERVKLLTSKAATDRTLGARLLANNQNSETIDYLIKALAVEKKLYPKIDICNSLVTYGKLAVAALIGLLGKIGTNQHKKVPAKEFNKDNYPLPRDIAARTIVRMGSDAIPQLVNVLDSNDTKQLSEAIDAIGFICFYDYVPDVYNALHDCYTANIENDLIKWKIIRAMSSFPESRLFLEEQKELLVDKRLLKEIERSLRLVGEDF